MALEVGAEVAVELGAEAAIDAAAVEAGASAAAAYEGSAASVWATAGGGGLTAGGILTTLGKLALTSLAAQALAPKIGGARETGQGSLINTLSSTDPIPVVYGSRRIGATVVPLGVSGQYSQFLHVLAIWGEGPIQAINAVYLDGVDINDARFAGWATIEHHLGDDSQAASSALIAAFADSSKWDANCTLSGIAYSYLTLTWVNGLWRGKPLVTADVDGKKLYDPRSGVTAFSRNPWLALRDYLTSARYGRAFAASLIDDTTFSTEADHADELVTAPDGAGGTTTQKRYTCDGVVNIDDGPLDITNALKSAARGALIFTGGKYKARGDRPATPTSFVLNESNIVGSWSFQLPSTSTRFNRVKARLYDADAQWQPNIVQWPEAGSAALATYMAQDAGYVLATQLELPFTRNQYTALQIAQIETKKSRYGILVSLVATIAAMALEVGDVVPLAHATPGWPAPTDPPEGKLFRVIDLELLSTDEVRLGLQEYNAGVYTLDGLAPARVPPSTSLPDIALAGAPGTPTISEALYETTGSAGLKTRATVSWAASADIFVQRGGWYQLERSPSGLNQWTVYPQIASPGPGTVSFVVDDVAPAVYDWRVAAFNSIGAQSAYSAVARKEIEGLNVDPSNVTGFFVTVHEGRARCHVDEAPDLDVYQGGNLVIRWSPLTVGATWNDGSLLKDPGYPGSEKVVEAPLYAGTYMAKWRDSTGHLSRNEASFVVTEALLSGFTTLSTLTFHPAFAGAKVNTVAADGFLYLSGATLWDDIPGPIDGWSYIDSTGGIPPSGSCTFTAKQDLGSVKTVRLFPSLQSLAFDTTDHWDLRTDLMDSWGLIDGSVIEDAEIVPQVRSTSDDPNAVSPAWQPWHNLEVSDYTARGFEYRTLHSSGNVTHNRRLSAFSVAAKQKT